MNNEILEILMKELLESYKEREKLEKRRLELEEAKLQILENLFETLKYRL
ncbi:hypothetical protein [Clostridium perfringens]|uniref:Uncharacterized protein n=2 Tax=Clostridium perfringens TaxID=1502 RepID=A0AAP7BXD0_CLOPF|nr:hypothetical protein [Clostridium perfringens]EDT23810.1 hypothetical protein AC1_0683 [Clostridium perfringens B str. ATCC 3626]NGU31809.1 hypothetical protein [Clostridium perfringens]WEV05981.1 hypothetical protein PL322_03130 [Clostridium perfringens B]